MTGPEIHQLRRGNKYSAAHYFRRSWPTTTGPAPCTPKPNAPTVSCSRESAICSTARAPPRSRRETWREHTAAERAWQAAYERMAADAAQAAERSCGIEVDGLEL